MNFLDYFCPPNMNTRIAFFHERFPLGGAERVTLDLCEYLLTRGYTIFLFTREYHAEKLPVDSSFNNRVEALVLPDSSDSNSRANARFIAEKARELNIEVLIIQAYVLESIPEIRALNEKLKVVYCNHGMPFWEIRDKIARKKGNVKVSLSKALQYYLIDIHKVYTFKTYYKRFYRAYKKLYDEVDAYVTLCEGYSELIREKLHLKDAHKLFAISNSEKPVRDLVLDKQRVVLFVGRLSYADKRVDRLLDVWHLLKGQTAGWRLIIVGEGAEKKNLEAQARRLELDNVEFAGFSNHPKCYYDMASILCMTSSFEGWGLVLTEAQANGVVPIAFGCSDGVKSILSPSGVNGVVVEPFDLEAYARELLSLMNDDARRKQMQRQVIEKSKSYSPEVVGKEWIALLNQLERQS